MSTSTDLGLLRKQLESFLRDNNVPFRDRGDVLSVRRGSSVVFVKLTHWMDTHAMIELFSPVLTGVNESEPLLRRLNELNIGLYFGKAYWHDRGVWIAHNLLGDHCDAEEFLAAVGVLGTVSDKLDDELKTAFGGTRWIET